MLMLVVLLQPEYLYLYLNILACRHYPIYNKIIYVYYAEFMPNAYLCSV
jgi:hypothetical protein